MGGLLSAERRKKLTCPSRRSPLGPLEDGHRTDASCMQWEERRPALSAVPGIPCRALAADPVGSGGLVHTEFLVRRQCLPRAWRADLGAQRLVRASFVRPPSISRRRLHQTFLGGLGHHRCFRAAHAAGPHLGAGGSGGSGRPGPTQDAFEGPRAAGSAAHHRYVASMSLHRIDTGNRDIEDLSARI